MDSKSNTYYINRIIDLSSVYSDYISYYSIVDGIPVIISSKKDGFINPDSYTTKFINLMTQYINDDLLMDSIEKYEGKEIDYILNSKNGMSIDHSEVWRVKNGELTKKWKKHPIEEKVMIANEDIDLMDYFKG